MAVSSIYSWYGEFEFVDVKVKEKSDLTHSAGNTQGVQTGNDFMPYATGSGI